MFGEVVKGKIDSIGLEKFQKADKVREGAVCLPRLLTRIIALVSSTVDSFGGSFVLDFFLMTVGD